MSEKTNDRLEHEAREALVAADLSAKMKQWRNTPPPDKHKGRSPRFRLLFLLLAVVGVVWWFWPITQTKAPSLPELPSEKPANPPPVAPLPQAQQETIAQKPAANKYIAMAQSNYRSPDFGAEIRGNTPATEDALDDARRALAEKRPADALAALKNIPPEYQTDAGYLRAHALFAQKKYAPAATLFGQLTGSIRYGEAAQWYQILALLPDFERNKSMIMNRLKKIAGDEGHIFQKEAIRLNTALK